MRERLKISEMILGVVLLIGSASVAVAETDPPLPPGPNRTLVEETCTPCHSAAIIVQNRMTRQRWNETITWMQDKQGLEDLSPGTRNQILDYLETVQGMDSKVETPTPKNRGMYEFDYPPNPL